MALVDLWQHSKEQLTGKHFQQIIAFAGDGKLRDGSVTSQELRSFLAAVPSSMLQQYAGECLAGTFVDSGLALQEIVNQVGHRLGFSVEHGRYRGIQGAIGFDGSWRLSDGRSLIIEVKTTDAYRIDLDTIAGYRRQLIAAAQATEERSSILIVVGRQDTGDLEAQIRGSRHAWDVRLISVEALLRLMVLKEEVEDPNTLHRIHDILFPREFTKLDEIVNLVFSAAEDAKHEDEQRAEESEELEEKRVVPVAFHEACLLRIQAHVHCALVRQSRVSYTSPDGKVAVVCPVSKQYARAGRVWYWFAFHPHQRDFLSSADTGYVAFGCGSEHTLILIPCRTFTGWLDGLHTTEREDRFYWHVHIFRDGNRFTLSQPRGRAEIDLTEFLLPEPQIDS